MSSIQVPAGQRFLMHGVDWQTYERLLRVFGERPAVRLTYDRGTLEIMSPLHEHESDSYLLGRIIDTLTEELGLAVKAGRSTTLRRRRAQRGIEPDNCYWIAHEPQVRGKRTINRRIDPPPDLAVEVDVTRSSLNRMRIYAKLGVPEVWRLDGPNLTFQVLGANGRYADQVYSLAFPWLRPDDLAPFLSQRGSVDENTIIRQFRAWIRQRAATGGAAQP